MSSKPAEWIYADDFVRVGHTAEGLPVRHVALSPGHWQSCTAVYSDLHLANVIRTLRAELQRVEGELATAQREFAAMESTAGEFNATINRLGGELEAEREEHADTRDERDRERERADRLALVVSRLLVGRRLIETTSYEFPHLEVSRDDLRDMRAALRANERSDDAQPAPQPSETAGDPPGEQRDEREGGDDER